MHRIPSDDCDPFVFGPEERTPRKYTDIVVPIARPFIEPIASLTHCPDSSTVKEPQLEERSIRASNR